MRADVLKVGSSLDDLGNAVMSEAKARLWYDKDQLESHIQQVIDTFDSAVASLEKEKAKLESDLKNADMKLLVLYEELLMLNDLEEKDEALLKKSNKCRNDKAGIMHKIKECQDHLVEKKAEIEQWQAEEANLQAEFTDLVGESSPFLGTLLKIYKKKVKRSKRKKAMGDDDDMDEEDEESEEDSDLDSEEDEDEMEEDICPQGCDMSIYESVLDLRDKRLDMEDALQEIQKAVDDLKRDHTKLLADEKRIDKEQKQTDAEIQQFQTEKQRKLNQVPIVFTLRLSQVQCLTGTEGSDLRLPVELNDYVVFTRNGLQRLMSRITELHQEIRAVKQNHRQLKRDYVNENKEKKVVVKTIEDLNSKFQDIQMLKFGQIVDLDLIEKSAPNKYVMELQEKVTQAEGDNRQGLAKWERKIEKSKQELARVTRENTSFMEQIVNMGYSQLQLDSALNARIANVTVNDTEPMVELKEMERERMKDLLQLQAKEIATLQAEINLFRKKGGHIYTTVTANRLPAKK
jgi:chromosome segregation ATPase